MNPITGNTSFIWSFSLKIVSRDTFFADSPRTTEMFPGGTVGCLKITQSSKSSTNKEF